MWTFKLNWQKNMQPMFNKNSIEERRADIFIKKNWKLLYSNSRIKKSIKYMKTLKFRFLRVLWNWNVCDMWGSNIFWIFIVGFQKRNFRVILWGADMREISTEEFRKLSADKKARTFPINTHTRPLSYTGRGWELDKSKTPINTHTRPPIYSGWKLEKSRRQNFCQLIL